MNLLLLLVSFLPSPDPITYQTVEHSEAYEFRVNYWFNMHHFLNHEAFLQAELDSSFVEVNLPAKAQKQLDIALDFYKESLAGKDLRTDDYMDAFKVWVTEVVDDPKVVPDEFVTHFDVLRAFSGTYQHYFWIEQEESCKQALAKYLPLIRKSETKYWEQILDGTKAFIKDDTIKVDVVYVGKADKWNIRNRPYTSIFPTRVVMNTYEFDEVEGEWLELLFHESAHALILSRTGFVAGTIIDVANSMDVKIPRQLGHAYLFYMTGYYAQQLLQEEGISYPKTYMEYRNVFGRYHEALSRLDEYLEGRQTLAETTTKILEELSE